LRDFRRIALPVLRGTFVGSILGVLPGGGAAISSFASYSLEKKLADDPSRFGKGAIEGVAGPESANNAGAQTSFIPMLTLGIPGNAVMALMIGALTIHGIQPGPQVMTERPALFWGMVASTAPMFEASLCAGSTTTIAVAWNDGACRVGNPNQLASDTALTIGSPHSGSYSGGFGHWGVPTADDDVVISNFTAGAGNDTWPLRILAGIRFGLNPELNAAAKAKG
jgi:hypothetical protein